MCQHVMFIVECVGKAYVLCMCVWVDTCGLMKENNREHPDLLYHILKQLHGVHDVLVLKIKERKTFVNKSSGKIPESRFNKLREVKTK